MGTLCHQFLADIQFRFCSEFTMAEIEHYVDPLDKRHARFDEVKDVKLMLLPKDVQSAGRTELKEMSVGEAVAQVINYISAIRTRELMLKLESC